VKGRDLRRLLRVTGMLLYAIWKFEKNVRCCLLSIQDWAHAPLKIFTNFSKTCMIDSGHACPRKRKINQYQVAGAYTSRSDQHSTQGLNQRLVV